MSRSIHKGSSWRRWLGYVATVVLTVVGLLVLTGLVVVERFVHTYNEVAAASREAEYTRASPPTDWQIEDGPAADAYEHAFDECRLWEMDKEQGPRAQLIGAYKALTYNKPYEHAVTTDSVGESCIQQGLDGMEDSAVRGYLTENLCRELVACGPALDRLSKATRRRQTRSPYALWRDHERVAAKLTTLEMAFLLRASLTSPQVEGEALAALLRLGQDLSRGADLFGATIGLMVRSGAIRLLRFRIADGEYDTNVSAQLIRELDHIRQQPIGLERAVDAEILQLTPALVYRPWIRDRLHAPPRVLRAPTPNNLYEEAAAFHFVLATWSVRAELTAASGHPERLAVYTRNLETYADSYAGFRLLIMTLLETYARHEVDVGSGTEALEIVHLALHARFYRLGTGRWPRSVDALEGGDVARTSALTGRPFTFKVSNGKLIISSDRSNLPAHTIPKPEWDRWSSLTLKPAGDREWVLRD